MKTESTSQNADKIDGLIDKVELARRIGKCSRTVDNWLRERRIPYLKVGRAVLFDWADVLAYMNARYRVGPRS